MRQVLELVRDKNDRPPLLVQPHENVLPDMFASVRVDCRHHIIKKVDFRIAVEGPS